MNKKILKKMVSVVAAMIILVGGSSSTSAMAAERVIGTSVGYVYGQGGTMAKCMLEVTFDYTYGRQVAVVNTRREIEKYNMNSHSLWPYAVWTGGSETAEVYAYTDVCLWYGEVCIDECRLSVYCDVYGYVG